MAGWFDILHATECPMCHESLQKPSLGLYRPFCEICTATLPDILSLHLDRAATGRWFLRWFQISFRVLRTTDRRRAGVSKLRAGWWKATASASQNSAPENSSTDQPKRGDS